jgi:hypothetical protein
VDVDVSIVADAGDTASNAVVVVIICDFESGDTKEVALEMGESNMSVYSGWSEGCCSESGMNSIVDGVSAKGGNSILPRRLEAGKLKV